MKEDRVSMMVAYVTGVSAFVLLALVAERAAVTAVDLWRYPWIDDSGGRLLEITKFWLLLTSLAVGACVSFGLAWMMREITAEGTRITLFAAFAFLVTAFMAITFTATAVQSGALTLISDDYLAMFSACVERSPA